jgi:hypothetical protein
MKRAAAIGKGAIWWAAAASGALPAASTSAASGQFHRHGALGGAALPGRPAPDPGAQASRNSAASSTSTSPPCSTSASSAGSPTSPPRCLAGIPPAQFDALAATAAWPMCCAPGWNGWPAAFR